MITNFLREVKGFFPQGGRVDGPAACAGEPAGREAAKHRQPRPRHRRCRFLYHDRIHPIFGFMHARIPTWYSSPEI